jgi:hypothetical protein
MELFDPRYDKEPKKWYTRYHVPVYDPKTDEQIREEVIEVEHHLWEDCWGEQVVRVYLPEGLDPYVQEDLVQLIIDDNWGYKIEWRR